VPGQNLIQKLMSDKPIFKLAPIEDDQTKRVLQARREVLCDPTLDYGARCLWCLLTDASYLESMHEKTGVIAFSKTQLADLLKCSPRAVAYWRAQLQARGYIWTSDKAIPNAWPVTVWHVTVLDAEPKTRLSSQTTAGGLLNSGVQSLHPRPRNEKRSESGKFCTRAVQSLPTGTAKFAPGKGKVCTSQGKQVAHGKGKVCTGERQSLPLPTAKFAPGNGNRLPTLRSLPTGEMELKEGEGQPPPLASQDEAFMSWIEGIEGLFDSALRKRLQSLEAAQKIKPADLGARKIAELRKRLDMPEAPPDKRKAPPPPPPAPPKALTPDELIAGAKYLVEQGKAHLLTDAQKAALETAAVRA
jgi:hypothetical protein